MHNNSVNCNEIHTEIQEKMMKRLVWILIILQIAIFPAYCENSAEEKPAEPSSEQSIKTEQTLNALYAIVSAFQDIREQIKAKEKELQFAGTSEQKDKIKAEINAINERKNMLEKDFEHISTGIDLEFFESKPQKDFKWQEELHDLLGPVIGELKNMTEKPRQIEKLRSEASYYESRLAIARKAMENLQKLIAQNEDKKLKKYLADLEKIWSSKAQQINNQLTVINYQLEEKLKEKKPLLESTQNILRMFFKSRGQNLLLSLLALLVVLLILLFIQRMVFRILPERIQRKYPFYIRLSRILYQFVMLSGAVCAMLIVLYVTGDWVLLSIAIIFLIGIVWTARQGFTKFWEQIKLLLNLGAVRENERIVWQGISWKVVSINLYSHIENPELRQGRIRLPLGQLVGLTSRPYDHDEPWFPCRIHDWLLLSDGTYGRVIMQTPEIVQLVLQGGSHKTYQTQDFLKTNPINLSTNFRVSIVFGIDYAHQKYITRHIPDRLREMLVRQLIVEGYGDHINSLRVEFNDAGASSLNLAILADFKGEMARYYQSIIRTLPRICVDACNCYGWNIPFTQITVHQTDSENGRKSPYETVTIAGPESPEHESSDYQHTIVIQDKPASATQTIVQHSPEQTINQPTSEIDLSDYSATESEKEFYETRIKKEFGEKYRFYEKLVSGGMGAIFKVLDRDLRRITAMKVLLPGLKDNPDTLTNFVTEAKITGFLEHPNIIPVHELGLMPQSGIFFTMKLAKGETLNKILAEIRAGNEEYSEKYNSYHLLSLFRKICDAVSFAHSVNIVHQDIKPHNIMVGNFGEVFLMDWGIAKYVGDSESESIPEYKDFFKDIERCTKDPKSFHIKGSPAYMSPEQVSGDPSQIDKFSDIFLLGATLYHIFTLEPPYQGDDIQDILLKAKKGEFVAPERRNPDAQIPSEISRIIMKAMAYDKYERYLSAEAFAKDIDDFIAGKWSPQEKKYFAAGELLMKEGEIGEEAYVIIKGKVQIFRESGGHKVVLNTSGEGDIIGEIALITRAPRSASVEAVEDTEVAVFTDHLIAYNIRRLPPYMEKIVSVLTERLLAANANIHPHLTRDCTDVVLKQFRLLYEDKLQHEAECILFQEVAREISDDLGIPDDKVCEILLLAIAQGLLVREENDTLRICDTEALNRFIGRLKS